MVYTGSCHCGLVTFQVEGGPIDHVVECNCSICSKRGSLFWFVPGDKLRLTSNADLSTYTFNTHTIRHRFCPVCGILPFGQGTDKTGKSIAAINVRCLNDIDLSSIKKTPFDGRSL